MELQYFGNHRIPTTKMTTPEGVHAVVNAFEVERYRLAGWRDGHVKLSHKGSSMPNPVVKVPNVESVRETIIVREGAPTGNAASDGKVTGNAASDSE